MDKEQQNNRLIEKLAYEYRTKVNTDMNQQQAKERIVNTFRKNEQKRK